MNHNWHDKHISKSSVGELLADKVATSIGSWGFIIASNVLVLIWAALNVMAFINHWDPYPFILLNLVFSWFAFNSTPLIMMSQNRAAQRDRLAAEHDYEVNEDSLAILKNQDIMLSELKELLKGEKNG